MIDNRVLSKLVLITIVSLTYTSVVLVHSSAGDINPNDAKANLDDDASRLLMATQQKRAEEVPNYGFLSDEEPDYNAVVFDGDGNPIPEEYAKRSAAAPKPLSDPMRTCMLYATHLLNLICETDNWMATSYYKLSDKRKLLTRCCLSPCSLSTMKMHCRRRTESDAKHQLTSVAVLLRPDIAERLPTLPLDNSEIEKAKYSITPNGFFGAFHP